MTGDPVVRVLAVLALLAAGGMGCAQNDEVGGGEVSFALPSAGFTVAADPSDPRWRALPPDGVPNVVCSGPAALTDDCCRPPARGNEPAKIVDCQSYPLSCDAAGWCALAYDYDDQSTLDLGGRVPALQQRRGWVLAKAEMDAFEVKTDMKAGFPIESAALYVAPQGFHSSRDPTSSFLTAIPLDGGIPLDPNDPSKGLYVALDANARFTLSTFLVDFNTPFALILSVRVAIEAQHIEEQPIYSEEIETATFTIGGRVRATF